MGNSITDLQNMQATIKSLSAAQQVYKKISPVLPNLVSSFFPLTSSALNSITETRRLFTACTNIQLSELSALHSQIDLFKNSTALINNLLPSTLKNTTVWQHDSVLKSLTKNIQSSFSQLESTFDFEPLLKDVSIQDDCVELSAETFDKLSDILDISNNDEICENISEAASGKYKISFQNFLQSIIVSLICMVVPMIQNAYYHKIDLIEAQQKQLEQTQYEEQLIQLNTKNQETLEEIEHLISLLAEYVENYSVPPEADSASACPPTEAVEFPIPFDSTPDGTPDEICGCNMKK